MSTALAILCPGQGSQYPEMFDRLSDYPEAEAVLGEAAAILGEHPRTLAHHASPASLFENRLAQPLICTAELAMWAALRPRLPAPLLFAGYSVGEIAAYGCAGALSVGSLLQLALQRAALMDKASDKPSTLLAVRGLEGRKIEALCTEFGVEIAIINAPDHFIIGAPLAALEPLKQAALTQGAHTVRCLQVAVAAHTSLLSPASQRFLQVLEQSDLTDPITPVLAGISGAPVRDRATALTTLAKQLSATINWQACLETALEMGCRVFLELGPGSGLARMVRDTHPEVAARSVEEFRCLEGVANWVMKQV